MPVPCARNIRAQNQTTQCTVRILDSNQRSWLQTITIAGHNRPYDLNMTSGTSNSGLIIVTFKHNLRTENR